MISSITIFGKSIPLYGILCVVGIAVALVIALNLAKKSKLEFFDFVLVAIITGVCAFIGAKVLFIVLSWDMIVNVFREFSFVQALDIVFRGGFVFYGGLIGGAIGLFITMAIRKENVFKYSNIYALVLPLGHAFGRVGCFFSGCCYGMELDSWASVTYTNPLDMNTPVGVPLLAVQLIEGAALLVLFILLASLYSNTKNTPVVSLIYVYGYSLIRFVLEFFRGDAERGLFFGLSTSQWISIALFVIALIYTIVYNIKKSINRYKIQ